MSRETYVWDRAAMKMVPAAEYYARKARDTYANASSLPAPMLMRDVEPYRSVITGETIGGRRQHRDHLRAHGCVEVGNDFAPPKSAELPPVSRDIERAIQSETLRAEAMAAAKRAQEAVPE